MLNKSHAVVFHLPDIGLLPKYHLQHQYWVATSLEAPVHRPFGSKYNSVFDLTRTYRTDADILLVYGETKKINSSQTREFKFLDMAKRKSRLAAWIVSNCHPPSKREEYVKQLAKYMSIDIYGKCGTKSCPSKGNCYDYVAKDYKFYLAFENAFCKDYITEKAWNPLRAGLVPVVLGMGPYDNILPPKSYIDVRNFSSPKLLAEYLKRTDANDDLYNSYFSWKRNYHVNSSLSGNCLICKYLNENNHSSVYPNFEKWRMKCMNPEDYYRNITH